MENTNKMLTTKAAGISIFVSVILFIVVLFGAQIILPQYFFQTSSYYVVVILLEAIPLGIGVFLYLFLTKQNLNDIIIFSKPQAKMNNKNMLWLIVLGALMAVVGRWFLSLLQLAWLELLEAIGYNVTEATLPAVDSLGVFVWALLGIAFIPAVFEELIFRGILQKGLLRSSKPKTAIIISSVMFMLMHLNVESMAFTFTCGILLGYMAYKSGSIVPSMAFHFVNNAFAVISLYAIEILDRFNFDIQNTVDISQYSTIEIVYLVIYAVISVVLLAVALWGFKKIAKSPPENPYLKSMEPVSLVLIVLSGCILFLVMSFLAIVQNAMLI